MMRLVRMSAGGIFQYFVGSASWIGMVRIAAGLGGAVVAGYTVAIRIIIFAILPSWGMANAAATLVGQNLGARKPERAEQSVWRAGVYNTIFLGSVAALFIAFAGPMIRLFTVDPAIVPIAVSALRFVSYGYVFYAWGMVIVQAFNGAGDTYTPTVLNLVFYWALRFPLAWLLAFRLHAGANGLFLSIPIADAMWATTAVVLFRRGKWKQQKA